MTGISPSDILYPDASGAPRAQPGVRTDLDTMLHPFFPEADDAGSFEIDIQQYRVRIYSAHKDYRIATPSDRKLISLLAGRIGEAIRSGLPPSRHVILDVRDILDTLNGDGIAGGTEYQRINEGLSRLAATKIVTNIPIGSDVERERTFGWIDAFEQDIQHTAGGRRVLRVKVSLSEDAFNWITQAEGFDLPQDEYQALTSSRSSVWRIYEICLAQMLRSDDHVAHIPIDELRRRVPIVSELKVFKARTLKAAMETISRSCEMSRHIRVALVRKTSDGFEPVNGKRAPLDTLYVKVEAGSGPLPQLNQLITQSECSG